MTTENNAKIKTIKALLEEIRNYGSLKEVEEGMTKLQDQITTIENLNDDSIPDESISGALEGAEFVCHKLLKFAEKSSRSFAKQDRLSRRIR